MLTSHCTKALSVTRTSGGRCRNTIANYDACHITITHGLKSPARTITKEVPNLAGVTCIRHIMTHAYKMQNHHHVKTNRYALMTTTWSNACIKTYVHDCVYTSIHTMMREAIRYDYCANCTNMYYKYSTWTKYTMRWLTRCMWQRFRVTTSMSSAATWQNLSDCNHTPSCPCCSYTFDCSISTQHGTVSRIRASADKCE